MKTDADMNWGRYNLVISPHKHAYTSTLSQQNLLESTNPQWPCRVLDDRKIDDLEGFLMTVSQDGNQKVTEQKPEYSNDQKLLELRWRAGDDVADGASCQQNFRNLEEKQEEDGYWWRGASTMVYLDGSIRWRFEQLSTWNFDRDQT